MIFLVISIFLIVGYVAFRVFHWVNTISNICDNNPDLIFNDSIIGEVNCQEWSNVNVSMYLY